MAETNIGEIRFDELTENDTVVLETAHNVYKFHVRDSHKQMGDLEGGRIEAPNETVLGGTMAENEVIDDRLRVGGRALFFSSSPGEMNAFQRIITSPIAKIRVERDRAA